MKLIIQPFIMFIMSHKAKFTCISAHLQNRNLFNPFSSGTVFMRQSLTSTDVRFWRKKTVTKRINIFIMALVDS